MMEKEAYEFNGRSRKKLNPQGQYNWHNPARVPLKNSEPQRKIALILLLLTFLGIAFFWLRVELGKIWQELIKPQTLEIVSPGKAKGASTTTTGAVINQIEDLTKYLQGYYGVYIYSLSSKEAYGTKKSEVFPAASINKVPIMLAFYREIEKGNLSLNQEYELKAEDIQGYGTGGMRYQPAGTVYTYEQLLDLTGKQSDNTAAHVLANILGKENIEKFDQFLGLKNTSIEGNETTPEELGKLFNLVYTGGILKTEKYKKQFFDNLTKTDFEKRIPAGLPSGTETAHKVGSGDQAYHDCGIVFATKPYIICIMSRQAAEAEALEVIPKISQLIWEHEESR